MRRSGCGDILGWGNNSCGICEDSSAAFDKPPRDKNAESSQYNESALKCLNCVFALEHKSLDWRRMWETTSFTELVSQ